MCDTDVLKRLNQSPIVNLTNKILSYLFYSSLTFKTTYIFINLYFIVITIIWRQ